MIAIAIDDEPIALDIIRSHASKVPFVELAAVFTNAFDGMAYLQQNKVDLIFLDIKMPDISGIDFLKSLSNAPMVVFTTAYTEHAVQSFELDAIDYLLKPFSLSRFLKACNKAQELFSLRNQTKDKKPESIFIKDGYEQVRVLLDEILYIEASGNYTQLHLTAERMISSRITLNELTELLPDADFIRVHRAFIVAKNKVDRFDRAQVVIGTKQIPIGSIYVQNLKLL